MAADQNVRGAFDHISKIEGNLDRVLTRYQREQRDIALRKHHRYES